MKLIFLPGPAAESTTLDSAKFAHKAICLMALLSPFMAGAGLVWLLSVSERSELGQQMLSQWRAQLSQQESLVNQAQTQIIDELSGITLQVAELEARIIRLDALGEQIATKAQLDDGEFDFSLRPALGGPKLEAVNGDLIAINNDLPLTKLLAELNAHVEKSEQELTLLDKQLAAKELRLEAFVAGKPIKKGWMSSSYGHRIDPFSGHKAWHDGVDFAGAEGSDVIAVAGGIVTDASSRSGYGKMVELNHGNGYVTRYAHNHSLTVKVGDIVEKGQVIALMGSSGRSTGPHVHFEVLRNGKSVNPERYIYRASL